MVRTSIDRMVMTSRLDGQDEWIGWGEQVDRMMRTSIDRMVRTSRLDGEKE